MDKKKKILIIDYELTVRFVVKKLLAKYLDDIAIFTSDNGVQGVGYAMLLEPDLIILDSSLPKYSGRELIDFLITNPKFVNTPIIILVKDASKVDNLFPINYIQISKWSKEFPENLIMTVMENLLPEIKAEDISTSAAFRFVSYIGRKIIQYSNAAEFEMQQMRSNNIFYKLLNLLRFSYNQFLIGLFLPTFFFLLGREDVEENIEQKQIDEVKYRTKLYPAIGFTLSTIAIILVPIILLISAGVYVLMQNIP